MEKEAVVVDDELVNIELIKAFLEMMGWEVSGFSNPQDVLDVVNEIETKIDLLVTDFRMPHINGVELTKEIKKKKPQMKTICMSGIYDKVIEDSNCFDNFMLKPIKFKDFKEVVDKLFPPIK